MAVGDRDKPDGVTLEVLKIERRKNWRQDRRLPRGNAY
jgi:hypothetical protein